MPSTSLDQFRDKLQEYCRVGGISQKKLAEELGLNHQVLSRKLNGTSNASLTVPEVRNLIKSLAVLQILTTHDQAVELLQLANLAPSTFGQEEWNSPPLRHLLASDFAQNTVRISWGVKYDLTPQPAAVENEETNLRRAQGRSNLPGLTTRFIGRTSLVSQIHQTLEQPDTRIVTLLGPGGVGKTRLSLQVAREMQPNFTDGVFFVPLAGVSDPQLVPSAIAQALNLKENGRTSSGELIRQYLPDKNILLVLDNLEQVTGASQLLADLLAFAPDLKLLITSRIVLQIYGERKFVVPPLALPDLAALPGPDELAQNEASALFVERARDIQPDFRLNSHNYRAVAEICIKLGGLALALELAAASLRIMSPQALLTRLSDKKYTLLSGGPATLPARHQSLRNTFDWSYDLLRREEQLLFSRFGVFLQGWTLEAAMEICFPVSVSEEEKLILLYRLLDHNFIFRFSLPNIDQLFGMLEPLREFALDKLTAQGEVDLYQQRHALYYAGIAAKAEPNLLGPDQIEWFERLTAEQENLRAALQWLVKRAALAPAIAPAHHETPDTLPLLTRSEALNLALQMVSSMGWYWEIRGYIIEGRRWFARVLELVGDKEELFLLETKGKVLHRAGQFAFLQGAFEEAHLLYEQSLTLKRQLTDLEGESKVLNSLGNLALWQRDFQHALDLVHESMEINRRLADTYGFALSYRNLGNIYTSMGDYPRAGLFYRTSLEIFQELDNVQGQATNLGSLGKVNLLQGCPDQAVFLLLQSLELFEKVGDKRRVAVTLDLLGWAKREQGDYVLSAEYSQKSFEMEKELGDKWGMAASLANLGITRLLQGDYGASRRYFLENLALSRELGDKHMSVPLENLGRLAMAENDPVRAVQLCAAAEQIRRQSNSLREDYEKTNFNNTLTQAHLALADPTFDAAWSYGQALSFSQAIDLALH